MEPNTFRPISSVLRSLPTYTRVLDQLYSSGIVDTVSRMEKQQAMVNRALATFAQQSLATDLVRANEHLQLLQAQSDITATISQFHSTWLKEFQSTEKTFAELASIGKIALSDISYHLALTRPLLDSIDFSSLRGQLNVENSIVSQVQSSMVELSNSYRNLVESFHGMQDLAELPSYTLFGATREIATAGYALDVLLPQEDQAPLDDELELDALSPTTSETTSSDLESLLRQVDPSYVEMYVGAIESLKGQNPDRIRHVLTSLRELANHVLREFAPTKEVALWVDQHGCADLLDDNGNPTRRARFYYLSRTFSSGPLVTFARRDIDAHLELFRLYHRLHKKAVALTDDQLEAIVIKTESFLTYILRIAGKHT